MIPTNTGLNTALSGLEAMQAGLDTTSENISNASTIGYARQQVNLVDSPGLLLAPGVEMGQGATVQSITNDDDIFLDQQYWTQNASASNASTIAQQLTDLQSNLNDSATSGISSELSSFFASFNALSNSPTAATAQSVVSAGQTLAGAFQGLSQEMGTLQTQASAQLTSLTDPTNGQVSQYANQIATLNAQITALGDAGTSANELEDQRAQAINSLSALVTVKVQPLAGGADTLTLADGTTLVDGTKGDQTGAVTLPTTYTSALGGQIGALASLASTTGPIAQLSSNLDSVAGTVISDVNSLMPSSTPFFTGNSASTIAVSAGATPSALAAIASSSSVTPSGGGAATDGSDLMNQIANQSTGAINSYSGFVNQVGNAVDQAQDANTTGQALLTAFSDQQQSVSGVSLDEEMTNLITYQQGYQASARVMNTMQSVIQTLISSVGSAGL